MSNSKEMNKARNMLKAPFVILGSVNAGTSGATTYYVKPSFKCQLIGAVLRTTQNSSANENIVITKMTCTDDDLKKDVLQDSTNVTVTDVTSTAIMKGTTTASGTSHFSTIHLTPDTNNIAERDIDPTNNEGFKIVIDQAASAAIIGFLELDLLPI